MFVVAVGFGGAVVVADAVAEAVGVPDEPSPDGVDVVDAVGVAVVVALGDGWGCFTAGSGPQPTAELDTIPRQTHTKPEERMSRVHAKSSVASTGKTFVEQHQATRARANLCNEIARLYAAS